MVPIFKNKGDHIDCSNYRGITLICHMLKLLERLLDHRLRQLITLQANLFGFQQGCSTSDPAFVLGRLVVDNKSQSRLTRAVFIDLEKAYDSVPHELIWRTLRRHALPEPYVSLIMDMYSDNFIRVRTKHGDTEAFGVSVGLQKVQLSARSSS